MSRRLLGSPRSKVTAAVMVFVLLAALLAVRMIGGGQFDVQAVSSSHGNVTPIAVARIPTPNSIVLDNLTIPCWSCPEADAAPLKFRSDLDLLAPIGTGKQNAAEWFAAYTKTVGSRAAEADEIMKRRLDNHLGRVLPPNDPFLMEAEPWLDQAVMRFYPDVYAPEGFQTRIPNLMLALTLGRSFVARGQGRESFDDAMGDFRRTVRLGRLLRQDDVTVINDLVGLAVIRIGVEAIYERARREGRLDLALAAAVIAGEAPAQKLLSGARMTSAEVVPYLNRGPNGTTIIVPSGRFDEMRKLATASPDRRFRLEASASISLITSFGSGGQQAEAKQILQELADSADPIIASNARWHLANPIDEKHLDELLTQDE